MVGIFEKNYVLRELNNIKIDLNVKQNGYYSSLSLLSGTTIFPEVDFGKSAKHKYFEIGALPAVAGTSTTAHGLNINRTVSIYGTADKITTPTSYLPLPYASSTAADIIELYLDKDNIYIVVGKDMSAYSARVYIKFIE